MNYSQVVQQVINISPSVGGGTPVDTVLITTDSTEHTIDTTSLYTIDSGWEKVRDVNGDPMPIFKPSFIDGRFDKWQIWPRTIISDGGGNLRMWFIGDDGQPTYDYRVGYATSSDWGSTWTKYGTTPIYTDFLSSGGSRGIVVLQVVWNGTNHIMIYSGVAPNVDGLKVAQSVDGITGWSVTHSGLFSNSEFGFPSDFKYIDGVYYLWLQRKNRIPAGNLGPAEEVLLFSSSNLTNWTSLGVQFIIRGSQEFGVGNHVKSLQKPNGQWFSMFTWYMNRTQAYDVLNDTKEPSVGTKINESNNSASFIMNSQCVYQYPDYVSFHAPLGYSIPFVDVINDIPGTIVGAGVWSERDFLKLGSGQVVVFANSGSLINGSNFGIKMRVQIKTGTNELFKIGNDIIITLESLKLRVRLSSNGAGYQKDYITNVDISKPVGMDYYDDHIYISVLWDGTTIRMWNDFVEFTSGQITKTVDNALSIVNDSGADIRLGDSSQIELRSVSILDAPTATELQELDI